MATLEQQLKGKINFNGKLANLQLSKVGTNFIVAKSRDKTPKNIKAF